MSDPAVPTWYAPRPAAPSRDRHLLRAALLVVGLVVVTPVVLIALALFGHWSSERPQVAAINQSLRAVEHDLRDVATAVRFEPAEARAFVCCGDGGPTGELVMRGAGDLPSTVQAAQQALLASGWTIDDIDEDGSWFRATRAGSTVDIAVSTTSATAARFEPSLAAGETLVAVTGR